MCFCCRSHLEVLLESWRFHVIYIMRNLSRDREEFMLTLRLFTPRHEINENTRRYENGIAWPM